MPVNILDRLPLPNLRVYTSASVLALSACVYYATQVIKDPNWRASESTASNGANNEFTNAGGGLFRKELDDVMNETSQQMLNGTAFDGRSMGHYLSDVFSVLIREPICVWTMINMAFCWLILIGTAVQKLVFGELRVSEQQHLKDKFWNFVFYKFIFIFGVINVQYIDEVLLWCSWFSLLGFLHLLSQLAKDRFEYLSFSPRTPLWSHVKLLVLLGAVFALSGFMLLVSVFVGFFGGINTFAFMSAEELFELQEPALAYDQFTLRNKRLQVKVSSRLFISMKMRNFHVILLSIRTLHVIIRYAFHLYDMRQEEAVNRVNTAEENKAWERRGPVAYYTELGFELAALIVDFVHHLHMLIWSNILLSMASLVICMQLRYLFHEIQRRFKKHRNYLWVRNHLEQNYPMASSEELVENSDNCAICWEKMESARKLPCTHLFHNTCLLSWLEQDTSCPTCRLTLNIQNPSTARIDSPELQNDAPQPARRQLNHFFHFDGSRYVSWLPSFSVEVTHARITGGRQENMAAVSNNSQLDAMARTVQQLFPHIPMPTIINDLRITRSVELTIENVLDGRLVAPPMYREPEIVAALSPPGAPGTNGSGANSTTAMTSVLQLQEPTTATSSSSEENNCDIIRTSDAPGARSWEDFNVESVEVEDTANLGSRFSKSSSEREKILHKRKEHLIQSARKKYIEKHKSSTAARTEHSS